MLESSLDGRLAGAAHTGRGGKRGAVCTSDDASRMCESDMVEWMCGRQPDLKRLCPRGLLPDGGAPSNRRLRGGVLGQHSRYSQEVGWRRHAH